MIKELLKNKKILIILVIVLLSALVGLSYAYFVYNTTQDSNDIATSDCFRLTFMESNDISLVSAVPISESDGIQLTPYTFTIKNVCNKTVQYDINLEKLNGSTLDDKYLRIMLNNDDSFIYNSKEEVSSFINENAISSRNIYTGKLSKNEEKTYNLRLWLDGDADIEAADKVFNSKIVIISTLYKPITITFNDNGGSYGPESIEVIKDKEFEMPMSSPFKNGYVLAGWSEDSNATTPTYYLGNNYSFSRDTTLYAVWTDTIYLYNRGNEYEHITGGWTYNQTELYGRGTKEEDNLYLYVDGKNGVSSSDFTTNELNLPDGEYTLHLNYNKTQVRFGRDKWDALYYRLGSGQNVFSDNHVVGTYTDDQFDLSLSHGENLVIGNFDAYDHIYEIYLTAKYYDDPIVIVYDLNGGINGPAKGTYAYDANSITISDKIPYKKGYTFLGYSDDSSATTASYVPGNTYTFDDNTILFAIYRRNDNIDSYKIKDYMVALTENSSSASTDEIGFSGMAYDDYGNLRYVGTNPNNYIYYNCSDYSNQNASTCEIWRIIGKFGDNVKIIKNDAIGTYTWDRSDVSVNIGMGQNEWSVSELKNNLNDGYFNSSIGTCSSYGNDIDCDFYQGSLSAGLKNDQTRNMIETITWPTAAINGDNPEQINYNAVEIYSRERGTYTGKQCSSVNKCNDTIERTTSWTGKVGLMLPSDYVYAVGGSVRSTCLQKDGYDYDVDCKDYDWLYYFVTQWTMVPAANAVYPSYIYYVRDSGKLMAIEGETGLSRNVYAVRPVVALKSNIEIKDYVVSDGSYNNPYQIKIY